MLKYNRGDVMNILICDDNTAFAMQLQKDISKYFHNPNMNINAQFKKIVALSNLIQRIYHNDIRNMLP